MADNTELIELLKFYKKLKTIKRPEVGILTGKTVGQIAGVCHKNGIRPWPDISDEVIAQRCCQFPVIRNGQRHVCGKATVDSLRCVEHQNTLWNPAMDAAETVTVKSQALVELLQFYRKKASVTLHDISHLTGNTLKEITRLCRQHALEPWPVINPDIAQDRPCQFPILKNRERRICGLMRSAAVDADPLCCSYHQGLVWDPEKELY
jgi:hypothetical protein